MTLTRRALLKMLGSLVAVFAAPQARAREPEEFTTETIDECVQLVETPEWVKSLAQGKVATYTGYGPGLEAGGGGGGDALICDQYGRPYGDGPCVFVGEQAGATAEGRAYPHPRYDSIRAWSDALMRETCQKIQITTRHPNAFSALYGNGKRIQ